jgi:hypothetical protein
MNEVVLTAPTVGYNVEQRSYGNVNFVMWGMHDSALQTTGILSLIGCLLRR